MTKNSRMATLRIDTLKLDRQPLEQEQEQRVRRARRLALVIGLVAIAIFVLSILQMYLAQHGVRK